MGIRHTLRFISLVLAMGASPYVMAEVPADFLKVYESEAVKEQAGFSGFSATRGETFFKSTHGKEWSCASCHTQNPMQSGKHARTEKTIAPMAPAANNERFTSASKVEKWFRRNCNDVVGRACTAQEKGDVLTYLISLKK
jgi:hypothetical protein